MARETTAAASSAAREKQTQRSTEIHAERDVDEREKEEL